MTDLREIPPGGELKRDEYNALVREVRRLRNFGVAAPLEMIDSAGGIQIGIASTPSDPDACVVRLDDTCAGGGKYEGVIMNPPATLACAAPDLAMPEGMEVGDPCIISNVAEDGESTHNLATGKFHNGVIIGQDGDGNWLVNIEVGAGNCAPGTDTLTVVTDSVYSAPDFVNTVKTFEFDFCAGTITQTASVADTVFSTEGCDEEPTALGEFYAY